MAASVLESFARFWTRIFGSRNERVLKQLYPLVDRIGSLEPKLRRLSDRALAAKTGEFRARLGKGETLDDLLPEAFAVVRETAKRMLGQRHFDAQLLGGIVLHQGKIAEMTTGEGKTLVATLPAYLNALSGNGVHVVTVNDYLAERDRNWMGPIYQFLGLTVGVIQQSDYDYARKQTAYRSDITYGTNNEFGFDYLRDNMKWRLEDQSQRRLNYAIVDEVDSILIDEARTPLIISGPSEESTDKYYKADQIARRLKEGDDFEVKLKEHSVIVSERGIEKAEGMAGVDSFFSGRNMDWPHHLEQALRAHHLYTRDKEYVVQEGEIIIVDEFTGRLMPGRRWSDGLHQAVEAKEGIKIREENQTLATITFQNYFRMYKKIAGMTGTALTEAAEFDRIYKLDVVVMPTNRPLVRKDSDDKIYLSVKEKYGAIVEEIREVHQQGRPVLVGTISIENSEKLSAMLERRGIPHEVLNAKNHAREAVIVAKAGQPGHVTVATNMAGRGTDIVLGPGVARKGGLHILGTERHEARRIDNQLRGRSGRQGDPGSSRFYLSLQDDLMRKFARDWVTAAMQKLGMKEGEEIQHPWVSKAIERAQKKVEAHNFEIRKNLLEYDQVMNEQRKIVYDMRQRVLRDEGLRETIEEMIGDVIEGAVARFTGDKGGEQDHDGLAEWLQKKFGMPADAQALAREDARTLADSLLERVRSAYDVREKEVGPEDLRKIEKFLLLNTIDTKWKDHLYGMDALRSGIGLRSYGEMDPKLAYKREGYQMFSAMLDSVREEVTDFVFKLRLERESDAQAGNLWRATAFTHQDYQTKDARADQEVAEGAGKDEKIKPIRREGPAIGRNDPCPCGSGKKYKRCHGAGAAS
jgi:preprotein translocase subunit SecA